MKVSTLHSLLSARHFLPFMRTIDLLSMYKNIDPATFIEILSTVLVVILKALTDMW